MKKYFIHQEKGTYFVFIIMTLSNNEFMETINGIEKGSFKNPPEFYSNKISECESFINLDKTNDVFLNIKS